MDLQLDWIEIALISAWPFFVYGVHVKLTKKWWPFPTTFLKALGAIVGGTVALALAFIAINFLLIAAAVSLAFIALRAQVIAFLTVNLRG